MLIASLNDCHSRLAVFAVVMRIHLAAVVPCDLLQAVTNAEDGNARGEDIWVYARCAVIVYRVRTAGEDNACVRARWSRVSQKGVS